MRSAATATPTWTTPTRTRTTLTPTRTTLTARASALDRCIEPIEEREFLDGYWERRPLVVERDEPGRFDDVLSAGDVERLVCSGGLRHPGFRLVKAGEQFATADYTKDVPWRPSAFTGLVDVPRVLGEWERGASIVLQGLHLTEPSIAAFCRSLESSLDHPTQANAYYTPRSAQGLPIHHDTHDVFSLQLSGEKRWLVYEPVLELPLKAQRYRPELAEPGAPVLEVTLREGDTLYLPRGWLHQALTSDRDSLHLTVGVNVRTWLDAFRTALAECEDDPDFRRSPNGSPDELVERLRSRLAPAAVQARLRRGLVESRRPILDGQLRELRALDSLEASSLVERRPTVLAELRPREGGIELAYEGKTIGFPERVRAEVEFVAGVTGPFRACELPGALDQEGRLVLLRRLVREGFLRFSEE